jgi:hypothetical protein
VAATSNNGSACGYAKQRKLEYLYCQLAPFNAVILLFKLTKANAMKRSSHQMRVFGENLVYMRAKKIGIMITRTGIVTPNSAGFRVPLGSSRCPIIVFAFIVNDELRFSGCLSAVQVWLLSGRPEVLVRIHQEETQHSALSNPEVPNCLAGEQRIQHIED